MSDLTDERLNKMIDIFSDADAYDGSVQTALLELRRHRATIAKFEAWASRLDDLGGLTGCRAVAAGIRNTIKGLS